MDLRQMRYVLAVARHGSLRQAAKSLHVAMQSLSEQVATVEREIGVALFTRSRAGMSLTPAGEVFTAHATVALDAAQRVLDATRAFGQARAEPVRIAVATGLSGVTGELLRHLLVAHPDAQIRLADLRSASQIQALREGEITAGVAHTPYPDKPRRGIAAHRLRLTPVRALLRRDDDLAGQPAVSLHALASRPLLLPSREDAAALRTRILTFFQERGLQPVLGPEVHGYEMAAACVAARLGYTLCVPATGDDPDLAFLPLAEKVPPLTISLLTRRGDRSPAVLSLVAAARAMTRPGGRTTRVDRRPGAARSGSVVSLTWETAQGS